MPQPSPTYRVLVGGRRAGAHDYFCCAPRGLFRLSSSMSPVSPVMVHPTEGRTCPVVYAGSSQQKGRTTGLVLVLVLHPLDGQLGQLRVEEGANKQTTVRSSVNSKNSQRQIQTDSNIMSFTRFRTSPRNVVASWWHARARVRARGGRDGDDGGTTPVSRAKQRRSTNSLAHPWCAPDESDHSCAGAVTAPCDCLGGGFLE